MHILIRHQDMFVFSGAFYVAKGDSDDDTRCDEPFGCDTVVANIKDAFIRL